jgi:hypothetical protein
MALNVVRNEDRNSRHGVRVNWVGIFVGGLVTLALLGLSILLGNAIGLSAWNVSKINVATGSTMMWSWIYTLAATVLCFGVGANVGARAADLEGRGVGALHGLGAWALAGVFMLAYGLTMDFGFRLTFRGAGSDAVNWLLFCIGGAGLFAAALGGRAGAHGVRLTGTGTGGELREERRERIETRDIEEQDLRDLEDKERAA